MSNDSLSPSNPLARFCLTLEEYRRTPEGRVRGERDFVAHFFAHDATSAKDLVFLHLPREVRAPIVSGWKIRGPKSALRDDDARIQSAVHDALVAGDIDAAAFEAGLSADVLVRWVPLKSWWSFWRAGSLSERALLKALATADEMGLFDASWFLGALELRGSGDAEPKRGIEVLAEGLSKADLADWIRAVHQTGDGSPRGLLNTLGWEKIVRHTRAPILIAVLDALAAKLGLQSSPPEATAESVSSRRISLLPPA